MRWRSNSRFFRRLSRSAFCASVCLSRPATLASAPRPRPGFFGSGGGSSSFMSSAIVIQPFLYTSGCCGSRDDTLCRRYRRYLPTVCGHVSLYYLFQLQVCIIDLKVTVEGVPMLSRLSESPSCWHLRVTLTPERPTTTSSSSGYHHDSMIGESNVAIDPAIGGYGVADIYLGEFSPQ